MITLHEIPIYALSPKTLSSRYNRFQESFLKDGPPLDEYSYRRCLDHETFPQRCWKHNHVVGSIDILLNHHHIFFELYFPYPEIKRYNWRNNHKIYMGNISANCFRLFVDDNMSNNDMQIGILEMLDQVIQDHVPEKWYVDRQAFDTIHPHINYKSIIDNQQNNGEYLW